MAITVALAAPPPAHALELPYRVVIEGVEDDDLLELLNDLSQLAALVDRPPATIAGLQRRAERDVDRLTEVLQSRGYYDSSVTYLIEGDVPPVGVTVLVDPGPVYRLTEYRIEEAEPAPLPELTALGIELNQPAQSQEILDAERRLLAYLANRALPLAEIVDRRVVVDHADRTVSATVFLEPGPRARYGPVEVSGLETVDPDFVDRRIPWQAGEDYDAREVERARQALIDSGLFRSVRVGHAPALDESGLLPMEVVVVERPRRSIGAGVSFSTSEGFGGRVFWEHRNLFGGGEFLRLGAGGTQLRFGVEALGRKPDFFAVDQTLLLDFRVEQEDPDGFLSRRVSTAVGIERPLFEAVVMTAGVSAEFSRIEEVGVTRDFVLVGLPVGLRRDTTDDLLDPSTGMRTDLTATTFLEPIGSDLTFVPLRLAHSMYRPLLTDDLIGAGWFQVGTILGQDAPAVPADKRFYSGGGGSIRGYGFQLVGPLGAANNPLGGTSLIEVGAELRYRITESIGVVGFIEGGNVYRSTTPDLSEGVLWGIGAGLRYHTAIGPLRLDLAFPLDRRRAVDDAFQVYIGLGQAF